MDGNEKQRPKAIKTRTGNKTKQIGQIRKHKAKTTSEESRCARLNMLDKQYHAKRTNKNRQTSEIEQHTTDHKPTTAAEVAAEAAALVC